jgi:hypothetical protein
MQKAIRPLKPHHFLDPHTGQGFLGLALMNRSSGSCPFCIPVIITQPSPYPLFGISQLA